MSLKNATEKHQPSTSCIKQSITAIILILMVEWKIRYVGKFSTLYLAGKWSENLSNFSRGQTCAPNKIMLMPSGGQ